MTFFRYLTLTFWLALTTPMAQAQDLQTLQLLTQNPDLASQFEGLNSQNQRTLSNDAGVPTSKTSSALNAEDMIEDPMLVVQSEAIEETAESVVQRYFQILAGDILDVYGTKEFAQQQNNSLLFFNTMGKDYRLAPGDVIRVTLRGLTESDESLKIGRDGQLILRNLPPLPVSGMTIAEAEEKLLNILQYDDASAGVYMSLETARLITVQVSGGVKNPRTIAVPAYTPLSRVLAYAGGVKPTGSLRGIILRNREGDIEEVDFYEFLQSPFGANDPLVTDAARVFVPNQGATVAAAGFVANPAIFELAKGQTSISAAELLTLSGTTIIPPGLELEALYFDEAGLSRSRKISAQDEIQNGEVLNLRFIETRNQQTITVAGALLEPYEMAALDAVSVADLLKGGATMLPEARDDFALIFDPRGTAEAISLLDWDALANKSVEPGSTLHVFDQSEYSALVKADPNESDDPLVAALASAEVAEVYLNGERIGLAVPSTDKNFAQILQRHYRTTPQTNVDIAIIERADGTANAVSLRDYLVNSDAFEFDAGTKLHIFETVFLNNFVRRLDQQDQGSEQLTEVQTPSKGQITTNSGYTDQDSQDYALAEIEAEAEANRREQETSEFLGRLLTRAGIMRVRIDGNLRAILPVSEGQSISNVMDVLGIEQSRRSLSDLVLIETLSSDLKITTTAMSLAGDYFEPIHFPLSVEFTTAAQKSKLLLDAQSDKHDAITGSGVLVYFDFVPTEIFSPSAFKSEDAPGSDYLASPDVYPLFGLVKEFNRQTRVWDRNAFNISDVKNLSVEAGSEIFIFSRRFIDEQLNAESESNTGKIVNQDPLVSDGLLDAETLSAYLADTNSSDSDSNVTQSEATAFEPSDVKSLSSASRYVGGAVAKPGYYPVVGSVSLDSLLSLAGGTLDTADLSKIEIQRIRETSGSLENGEKLIAGIAGRGQTNVKLTGRYSVNVPYLINEVATGVITLQGEVMRPGDYVIGRDDTLHDIIKRAGGLSPIAYPLGAVFTRNGLKEMQREGNQILAEQLEQSVIQLASSEKDSAGEQIQAVLGYARQLRNQSATGRMSVNISYANPEAPVYLEPGDILTIPKRPSHVSVIGAVQKNTVARYAPDKLLSSYIANAGGLIRIADIRNAYLLLPNGESTQLTETTPIAPGSVIVVPPKTDRLSALGLTDLLSRVLGNIATSVLAINNVR